MKITKLQDIDLSNYKLSYYKGDCMDHERTHDEIMILADAGKLQDHFRLSEIQIALIPKDKRLQDCGGDDRDDCPASGNASGFCRYPEGTIFLQGILGGELMLVDKI